MAKRKNIIRQDENTRQKIRTSQLINRLTNHVLGKLKKPMDSTQVTAALGLLKKVLPDLSSTDVKGDIFNQHYVVSGEPMSEDEWKNHYENSLEPSKGTAESAG
jgi:hypothetical protein